MQGGKNWILPKEINANRFFWDSHRLEIWLNHLLPSMGPNGGSVAMDSVLNISLCRMWKKSADPSPPPPVGPPVTSSQAADAGRRFRRSPLLDEDEMAGLPSHAEGWTTLFDEFPRLLADVRRNAHIRADAELRGIRAYDADAASTEAKRGASYYSSRNLHRRDVESTTAADSVPKVLQPGRGFLRIFASVFVAALWNRNRNRNRNRRNRNFLSSGTGTVTC